jgi:hypothetical protein
VILRLSIKLAMMFVITTVGLGELSAIKKQSSSLLFLYYLFVFDSDKGLRLDCEFVTRYSEVV